jgi:hypothetical protein
MGVGGQRGARTANSGGKSTRPKLRQEGIKICLRCDREFQGSIENRICPKCKQRDDYQQ